MIPALSERAFYQDISFLDFQLSRTIPHESRHFVIPAVIEISLLGVLWSGGNEGSWLITIASGLRLHDQCHSAAPRTPAAGDSLDTSASKSSTRMFVITEKAPTRAFSWLNAATTAFTVDIRPQRPWVRFWEPKIAAASCTHLGPAQVMEVIIIDV